MNQNPLFIFFNETPLPASRLPGYARKIPAKYTAAPGGFPRPSIVQQRIRPSALSAAFAMFRLHQTTMKTPNRACSVKRLPDERTAAVSLDLPRHPKCRQMAPLFLGVPFPMVRNRCASSDGYGARCLNLLSSFHGSSALPPIAGRRTLANRPSFTNQSQITPLPDGRIRFLLATLSRASNQPPQHRSCFSFECCI